MPRPLEPVERSAFFGECTLNNLQTCNNQPVLCVIQPAYYTLGGRV